MKKSLMISSLIICVAIMFSISFAQEFPPTFQPGPFPLGTEEVRDDAPVDENDPDGVFHEYTAYKGTVVVDGDLSDPAWEAIPWTLMEFNFDVPTSEEGSMWSEDYAPSGWIGWEDLTCWFKIIHDDENIYVALLRYDDDYNTDASLLMNPGSMWQYDAYQMIFDTRYPGDFDIQSPGAEIGVCLVDGEEAYTFWATSHQNPATILELAEGDCESSAPSTTGKAIHGSLEEADEYLIEKMEMAFVKYDVMADDDVGMLSLCALDKDFEIRESVIQWAQGLYVKTVNEYGSILWSSKPVPSSGVDLGATETRPDEFELAQNYPNPFNPVTTINYSLSKNSIVTLKVYNTIGEEVATIIDQKPVAAGSYEVAFDGSNLNSGIYLYQLKCGTTVINKKMTLIK